MYKERREKLRQQMPDYSITVLFSGRPVHGDGDELLSDNFISVIKGEGEFHSPLYEVF